MMPPSALMAWQYSTLTALKSDVGRCEIERETAEEIVVLDRDRRHTYVAVGTKWELVSKGPHRGDCLCSWCGYWKTQD